MGWEALTALGEPSLSHRAGVPGGKFSSCPRGSDSRGKPSAAESLPQGPCLAPQPKVAALSPVGGERSGRGVPSSGRLEAGPICALRGTSAGKSQLLVLVPCLYLARNLLGGGGAPPHSLSAHLCQEQIGPNAEPAALRLCL